MKTEVMKNERDSRFLLISRRLREHGFSARTTFLADISPKALGFRYLLFDRKARCFAASNDKSEVLAAGAACAGPVVLVELPQ
jgi:hypothetical protein